MVSSILLSIFRRKGGEGPHTNIISEDNKPQFARFLSSLDMDETGLILYHLNASNWVLISSKKLIAHQEEGSWALPHNEIMNVTPAMQEEYSNGTTRLNNFSRLKVMDAKGKSYVLKIEPGPPYAGFLQVLHYIATTNNSLKPPAS